jgi:hypothetical protein
MTPPGAFICAVFSAIFVLVALYPFPHPSLGAKAFGWARAVLLRFLALLLKKG